ncbi:nuclear transport factor 2 family protein [Saccharopolyspora sp. HNM0983]|uniref:Nuclear transport factor 2 family protein n=1 Tax=Saccharopolyspora montiporae TaxID=2781240 RepID=A0A929BAJ3_9PSEU|nr:nuclear transport factor 2 family protein [Saccharopolyspora sp. HNM0983]MBE9375271.1 nuclear transport factor 2 family protein [Saccharopolyspora sp. HNM0983]
MSTATTSAPVLDRLGRWAAAEAAGDTRALRDLLTRDFAGIGPYGFVLDRGQWLDRFDSGDLVNEEFAVHDTGVRHLGQDVALVTGLLDQHAAYRGQAHPGRYRFTAILVPDGGAWRLTHVQLSPVPGR